MFCPRCGRQLLDSATFCPECGAPIDEFIDNGDALSALSSLETSLPSFDDETQFMEFSDVDLSEFDDSGIIEELTDLESIAASKQAPQQASRQEAYEETPLVVDVRPVSYDTDAYEPVYQGEAVPYIEPASNYYYDDSLYVIPETNVPVTYANVTPITGGVPTEHYLSRRRRRRRKIASTIVLLIFLIAAAGVAWYTWDQEMWGGKRVPAVVGLTEEAARSALTVKGLKADVELVPADSGIGNVLESEPAEGKRCATDTPVILHVADNRHVPEVVGMTVDEARAALAEEGSANVKLTYANSDQPEGTVLAVEPVAGEIFISTDPITLTIAQPYTVPEVVGASLTDARKAVQAAGLQPQIEYVQSWATRDTIIAVSPEAGTRVTENATVTLYAPIPYPKTVYELGYYYRITPEQTSAYLNYLNYTLEQGGTYSSGEGYERWKGASGDIITFTNEPESASGPTGTKDVFAEGTKWTAVRYKCPSGSAAAKMEVSEANIQAIIKACGLGGTQTDMCTQKDIVTPYDINREAFDFVCIQGEWGDYVWVGLISRSKSVTNTIMTPRTETREWVDEDGTIHTETKETYDYNTTTTAAATESTVIVAFMPKETTNVNGLSSYGNSFCDYFAYANTYSSSR